MLDGMSLSLCTADETQLSKLGLAAAEEIDTIGPPIGAAAAGPGAGAGAATPTVAIICKKFGFATGDAVKEKGVDDGSVF